MNGADRLTDVLLANDVGICFANPGTSEMHFVAALDRRPELRCILGLFEGVATGAADGYGRMTGRPAAVLLHTGPGLANGLANLHNARRARTPVLTVVGDHASYHLQYDAPLTTDIESLARPMSNWVGRARSPSEVATVAEEAFLASLVPGVATMILPADSSWGDVSGPAPAKAKIPARPRPDETRIDDAAKVLRSGARVGLLVGGDAAIGAGLDAAGRIAVATGAELFTEVLPARIARGRGRPDAKRIPYPIDYALPLLAPIDVLILCGAPEPVAFFAYPGKPSRLLREDARVMTLATPAEDQTYALEALADALGAKTAMPQTTPRLADGWPTGTLDDAALTHIIASLLPENAIVMDEQLTSAPSLYPALAGAPPHDHLVIAGGAIGYGIPCATGAAVACPDRKVLALQADGSGMYTLQGLWTQARERLDVVTLVFSNRRYEILEREMRALGHNDIGENASRMMTLDDPALNWVKLAQGMGVEAARAENAETLADLLRGALARRGPFLIECVLP